MNWKYLIIFIVILVADQLVKHLVYLNETFKDFGFWAINYTTNTGAGFGILKDNNLLLLFIAVIVLGVILFFHDKIPKKGIIPVWLISAGLVGNLIDRIFRGFVVDMLDFKWWPVFNVADSALVIGVIWLIIVLMMEKD
ncbi:MAG: signal peptidase II [archaeon]